jgi:dienelactone hydrolase
MAISFECAGCGKLYTVGDNLAGKIGQCKQCGQQMTIPTESDSEPYGLEIQEPEPEPAPEPLPEAASIPPRSFKPAPQSAISGRSLYDAPAASPPKKSFFGGGGNGWGGGIGVLIVLVGIGLRTYSRWERGQARNARNAQANALAPGNNGPNFNPMAGPRANRSGPIALPNFPDSGPAREIEPGIMLREVTLGPARPPMGLTPGFGGKLWLYLPSGEHQPRSLPCILITGAGSTLLTGMDLGDGDRPEHLPYVRAGFAVLAFELDGPLANWNTANQMERKQAMVRFLNARAGLVNAHIALEYALAKVPEVDPSRISVAGHSSAGTLAVLFAEHEPRLKACVAFAPALDIEKHFGPEDVAQLTGAGMGDLCVRYSPKRNEDTLKVPLFLFHARDDSNTPVVDSEAFAADLQARGKPVTLDLVPSGNHYDSMINEGIPHAIAWLIEQGAGPGK